MDEAPKGERFSPRLEKKPFLYVLYGIAMAALFEETARLVFFKWLEKKRNLEDSDALAYGLGHGGLELLYLGMGSLISLLILLSLLESPNPDVANLLPKTTLETVQSPIWMAGLFTRC